MGFFSPEGKLVTFITKVGELVLINLLWILTCIPVITIVPATTSFYYAVMKNIRRDRGTPVKEFFYSFKRTLLKGMLIEVIICIWVAILLIGRRYFIVTGGAGFNLSQFLYDFLLVITGMYILFLIPAFSRFDLKLFSLLKLTFVMTIRFIYLAIPLLALVVLSGFLMIRFIPWVLICLFPGVVMYVSTFLVEPALVKYTKVSSDDEDAWFLPNKKN